MKSANVGQAKKDWMWDLRQGTGGYNRSEIKMVSSDSKHTIYECRKEPVKNDTEESYSETLTSLKSLVFLTAP